VLRVVARQKRGSPSDLSGSSGEIDALLAAISEFQPEWTTSPCVYRLARLETRRGVVPFEDNVVLPAVKHTYELVLEMLGHIREQKDLRPVKMPLFIQPDEIARALEPVLSERLSATVYGPPHKDGKTISRRRQRRLVRQRDWSNTRRAALDRDNWECRQCGALKDLHLYRVDETLDQYDPAGYVILCRHCLPPERRRTADPWASGRQLEPGDVVGIRSQLALIFQKGKVQWVGFVLEQAYTVMKN